MNNLSRRRFLEDSLLSAAALATASIASESRAQTPGPSRRRVGPNEQVRIAVIGFKSQGMGHIGAYARMKDVTVAALCDVDTSQAAKGIKAVEDAGQPAPTFYQDIRKLLEDDSIDAVSIATPNHWHALASIWAMQAGKDVYVEKPVSHNVSEGRRMVEAARRYDRICQTGTQCRSMKGTIEAIEYVHSGKIGKVYLARGLCYKRRDSIGKTPDSAPPPEVDYNLWLGPAPLRPFSRNRYHYNWHWHWDYGNGDLGNQGIHQMDLARWGLKADDLPRSVLGFGGRYGYEDDGETPNTHVTVMDYGDRQLIFEVRGLPTPDLHGAKVGVIFYGTKGYVVLPSYDGGAAYDLDGVQVATFKGGGDHHRNFIDAVRSRRRQDLAADILEGHLSSALCHLGNISYRLGTERRFGSQRKLALGGDEAAETYARYHEHVRTRVADATQPLHDESGRLRRSQEAADKQKGEEMRELAQRLDKAGAVCLMGRHLKLDRRAERFIDDDEANALLTRNYRAPFVVPDKI